MTDKTHDAVTDLMEKGEGVLTKRGDVWTYPGCANDPSATNLVLPVEYVSDAAVQKALSDGVLSAAVMSPTGLVTSVRLFDEDDGPVLQAGHAGTPEVGTELPPGSRVESDAGMRRDSTEKVEAAVRKSVAEVTGRSTEGKTEGTASTKAKR